MPSEAPPPKIADRGQDVGTESTAGAGQIHFNLLPCYSKNTLHCRSKPLPHISPISLWLACTLLGVMYKDFPCTDHFLTNVSTVHSRERSYNYTKRSKWGGGQMEPKFIMSPCSSFYRTSPHPHTTTKDKVIRFRDHPMEALTALGCEVSR